MSESVEDARGEKERSDEFEASAMNKNLNNNVENLRRHNAAGIGMAPTYSTVSPEKQDDDDEASQVDSKKPSSTTGNQPPCWIKEGVKVLAVGSREGFPTEATVSSDPICLNDNDWVVTVKWASQNWEQQVKCSQCEPMLGDDAASQSNARSKRTRKAQPKYNLSEQWIDYSSTYVPLENPFENYTKGRKRPRKAESQTSDELETANDAAQWPRTEVDSGKEVIVISEGTPLSTATSSSATTSENDDDDQKKPAAIDDENIDDPNDSDNYDKSQTKPIGALDEDEDTNDYTAARISTKKLLQLMPQAFPPGILDIALDEVGYPFGVQDVMHEIQKHMIHAELEEAASNRQDEPEQFKVYKDMKILEHFQGDPWEGRVMHDKPKLIERDGKKVEVWDVEYEDDPDRIWQRDEKQLRRYRYPRPKMPLCIGRDFQFLELFAGRCFVSGEFLDRCWNVASIDIDPESNATIKMDIRDVDTVKLPFVADCIWASPDCSTYSRLAGGTHRVVSKCEYSRSEKACMHDEIFMHLIRIMAFHREKHPHCVFVIENPADGSLKDMPLMKEAVKQFDLVDVVVDYCAFGRDEQKPTRLWTNSHGLQDHLRRYRCKNLCSQSGHHEKIRGNTSIYDFSAVPTALAKEVARFVDSQLFIKKVQRTKAASPR